MNRGNMIMATNRTTSAGTLRHNSIQVAQQTRTRGMEELLPRASMTAIGREVDSTNRAVITVRKKPPHLPVSTYSRPNTPPRNSPVPINGQAMTRSSSNQRLPGKRGMNNGTAARMIRPRPRWMRQRSTSGYSPYMNWSKRARTNGQQAADLSGQSAGVDPDQ